jgi:Mg2+-importing ATPase
MENKDDSAYLAVENLLARLGSSQSGLASQEAENRLKIYGPNELAKRKERTVLVEFLLRFKSPLVIILLIAGLISGLTGEIVNAAIIFTIVLLSVVLDFYQESKAEKASEMLKEKVATTATVLRDSVKQEIELSEIVPGARSH